MGSLVRLSCNYIINEPAVILTIINLDVNTTTDRQKDTQNLLYLSKKILNRLDFVL